MKILLISPFGSNWIEGHIDKSATATRMAPIANLSLAAYLMKKGFEVDIYNCWGPLKYIGTKEVLKKVLSFKPDIIGFTSTTSSFNDAYRLTGEIKKTVPDTMIVFGGVHVSALKEKILKSFPLIDFLIIGEGEKALAELAGGENPDKIQGVIYRNGSEIKFNGPRTNLCKLDDLPFPAYQKLEGFPKSYKPPLFTYPQTPTATIISSRGCPYRCSYCDRSVFNKSFRFNSAEYLYEYMAFLKSEFNMRHIFFYDDLFTFHRRRVEEFCLLLQKKPLHITFNCTAKMGHIDDDLLKMLKAAGCWMVSLGIESGAPEILLKHKPEIDLNEVKITIKQIQKNGLRAKGFFMMGLPGETEETIKKTTDFIAELQLDDMNMTKFTPFPGSPIYKNIREEGVFDEKWELMNCMNFVFVPKGIKSKERLEELYKQFIKRFYTSKNWVRKFGPLMLKSPHSTYRMIKNLPAFLKIKKDFQPRDKH